MAAASGSGPQSHQDDLDALLSGNTPTLTKAMNDIGRYPDGAIEHLAEDEWQLLEENWDCGEKAAVATRMNSKVIINSLLALRMAVLFLFKE